MFLCPNCFIRIKNDYALASITVDKFEARVILAYRITTIKITIRKLNKVPIK